MTNSVRGVRIASGQILKAKDVILAVDPEEAIRLTDNIFTPRPGIVPVKMAALTIGLRRLPIPKHRAVFALDRPLYFSVHSAWANLTEQRRSALVHLGKYLKPGEASDSTKDRIEMEEMMDTCQPGWKEETLVMSFLPSITVTNLLVSAFMNGTAGRPAVEVPGIPGLYLCGDWVGSRGMLSDASLASAESAAQKILRRIDAAYRVA
jgi:phytoene dehydrogenase-like protein